MSQIISAGFRSRITSLPHSEAQLSIERAIYDLKQFQNEVCARTMSLPKELLSIILLLAVHPGSNSFNSVTKWQHRVAISSVCRAWCSLALALSAFWSTISIESKKVVAEMLKRSQKHPLSV
ncbi:hypothetical protein BDV98DRAFT_590671 [Pterulicium gracile]|uniref:Uncharacterized protein n=1 Tax=Pterulicium gracile TaxID=1884261 RepID=A0A5C3QU02_9AGAR|nr:hypothetical protein BDV98DRAFT_590671 [Pterula gracilis]